jgi:hypothetical protein
MPRHCPWCIATLLLAMGASSLSAIDLDVTDADIERVLAIARGTEAERARFHAPYIRSITHPEVEGIEVITELRRVALLAEERILKGDRGFSYSVTQTRRVLGTWRHRVSVVAKLRFHPQNNYIGVPPSDVVVSGVAPIGFIRDPLWSLGSGPPDNVSTLVGARIEASYDATTIGQASRDIVVRLNNKDLMRTTIDFGRIE